MPPSANLSIPFPKTHWVYAGRLSTKVWLANPGANKALDRKKATLLVDLRISSPTGPSLSAQSPSPPPGVSSSTRAGSPAHTGLPIRSSQSPHPPLSPFRAPWVPLGPQTPQQRRKLGVLGLPRVPPPHLPADGAALLSSLSFRVGLPSPFCPITLSRPPPTRAASQPGPGLQGWSFTPTPAAPARPLRSAQLVLATCLSAATSSACPTWRRHPAATLGTIPAVHWLLPRQTGSNATPHWASPGLCAIFVRGSVSGSLRSIPERGVGLNYSHVSAAGRTQNSPTRGSLAN